MELFVDLKNYDPCGNIYKRTVSRGIIRRDNYYLLIHSKYGDYKFPGGGVEESETPEQALVREVKEETGYNVITETIRYFGVVHETRRGELSDIMSMDSYYYFCEVAHEVGARKLDMYEAEYDYQAVWMELEKSISKNRKNIDEDLCPWVKRDTMVMEYLSW